MQRWCLNYSLPYVLLTHNKATQCRLCACPITRIQNVITQNSKWITDIGIPTFYSQHLFISQLSVSVISLSLAFFSLATLSFTCSTLSFFFLFSVLAHSSLTLIHHSFALYVSLSLSTLTLSLTLSFPPPFSLSLSISLGHYLRPCWFPTAEWLN